MFVVVTSSRERRKKHSQNLCNCIYASMRAPACSMRRVCKRIQINYVNKFRVTRSRDAQSMHESARAPVLTEEEAQNACDWMAGCGPAGNKPINNISFLLLTLRCTRTRKCAQGFTAIRPPPPSAMQLHGTWVHTPQKRLNVRDAKPQREGSMRRRRQQQQHTIYWQGKNTLDKILNRAVHSLVRSTIRELYMAICDRKSSPHGPASQPASKPASQPAVFRVQRRECIVQNNTQ